MTSDWTHRDICQHGGDPHSHEAHESVRHTKQRAWDRILSLIDAAGTRGMTCEEVEHALSLSHQTASARISELRAKGDLVSLGRRATASGRSARVHVAPKHAEARTS
jgi:predicted transcriptional regulator